MEGVFLNWGGYRDVGKKGYIGLNFSHFDYDLHIELTFGFGKFFDRPP